MKKNYEKLELTIVKKEINIILASEQFIDVDDVFGAKVDLFGGGVNNE